jgi:hypothetical protein
MTSRTLRIYPNKNQKEFLNRCFGTTRYLFNKSLNKLNELKDEYFNEQLKLSITNGCSHKTKIKNKYMKCKNELIKGKFLCKENIGLKKYKILPKVSKIEFSRSIVVKKEKLKIRRLSRTREELLFLKNIWDIYIIAQRLESWNLNDISTNKVDKTIELFFVKHRKITNFLDDNYIKNI